MKPSVAELAAVGASTPIAFSPDGQRLLVLSDGDGPTRPFAVDLVGGDRELLLDAAVEAAVWLPGSERLLVQVSGDGRSQLLLDEGGGRLRPVAPDAGTSIRLGALAADGRTIAFSTRHGPAMSSVHVCDVDAGEVRCVLHGPGSWSPESFSPDGRLLAVRLVTERSAETILALVDVSTGEHTYVSGIEGAAYYGPPSWLPDSSGFYFATDAGAEYRGLARYEIATGVWQFAVERDLDLRGSLDPTGRLLALAVNRDGATILELVDAASSTSVRKIPLPGDGQVGFTVFSADGSLLAFHFTSDTEPGEVWIHDVEHDETRRLTSSERPAAAFVESEVHRYPSFDGLWIPVRLYRPPDAAAPVPVVVLLHDGPDAQHVAAYHPLIQALVVRGIAVACPNVRGSTGYGKRYHHLDDNRMRMHAFGDVAYLHAWLEGLDGVDASRIALTGSGYGGFLALGALAFYPELWIGAAAVSPILDLPSYVAAAPAQIRAWREREFGRLDRYGQMLEEGSPLSRADDIRAPVLLLHGEADREVPAEQAEAFRAALDARGTVCEVHLYPEGRRLRGAALVDAHERTVAFLERCIAGEATRVGGASSR